MEQNSLCNHMLLIKLRRKGEGHTNPKTKSILGTSCQHTPDHSMLLNGLDRKLCFVPTKVTLTLKPSEAMELATRHCTKS